MATIGLDKLYYAPITEDESGLETYGEPAVLAKAMRRICPLRSPRQRCMPTTPCLRW